ncbi:MAG TPA: hypothetical protein VHT91_42555 [Kofleriaceae bacterium]|jgi:hypothetical protein|nr:hypothetical protein [Kofleriaceae bacterium]
MTAADSLAAGSPCEEARFVLWGVPWWTYVVLRDALEDHAGLKLTYLEGTLELMRPSLARYVRPGESQTELVIAYQTALRGR